MEIFSVDFYLFDLWGWKPSLMEMLGVVTGLFTVWLTARERLASWPWGMANALFFTLVLYQVNLYWDAVLNVFYFFASAVGWWMWLHPSKRDGRQESLGRGTLVIGNIGSGLRWALLFLLVACTVLGGVVGGQAHLLAPGFFPQPAAWPYPDAFTTAASLIAFFLQVKKKWESWVLWVSVDVVSVLLYINRGIYLMALVYAVFGVIATSGLINWYRLWKQRSS